MADTTNIEWCDATFNPWIGCTKVSPGCDNCYAARQDAHRRWTPEGWGGPRKRTKTWGDPVAWNKRLFFECPECRWRGDEPVRFERDRCRLCFFHVDAARRRVFCASLADWLDNQVPIEWLVDKLEVVRTTPNLDWLLLTKRIGNWRGRLQEAATHRLAHVLADSGDPARDPLWQWLKAWLDGKPPANVWIGATVVNQDEADRDIPKLLATPARVLFLSIEPMLGPVDLTRRIEGRNGSAFGYWGFGVFERGVDWVICGGESGPGARPMHPDWARSLRDQCAAAGVPFLFKQHGEWAPGSGDFGAGRFKTAAVASDGTTVAGGYDASAYPRGAESRDGWAMVHWAGKKAAGRLLDGITHDGFPEVA